MIYIFLICILILFLFIIPLKVIIRFNLEYFEFLIFNIKIYKRRYDEIKDINNEKKSIKFVKIFRIIDIQRVDLEIGGFRDYFYRSVNYGIIHMLFNLFSFIIKDQFIFNYFLDYNSTPKINFQCIIKSNMGKILIGLLKRRN